jgi:hypothetical protein
LLAAFGAAIQANTGGSLCINGKAGRLHNFDEQDADVIVKLCATRKFNDLPEGCVLGVTALRRRVRTDTSIGDVYLML